jgi:hypothetical protein
VLSTDVLHLDSLLTTAVRCEVTDRRPGPRARRWELVITDRVQLAELRGLLSGVRVLAGKCACAGDLTLRFFDERGGMLALVVLHHSALLGRDGGAEAAALSRGREVLEWLAEQGLDAPLQQLREEERRLATVEQQWRDAVGQWRAVAPESVRSLLPEMLETSSTSAVPRSLRMALHAALTQEYPDDQRRCLALLRWSSCRPGHFFHEDIPELLLRDLPMHTLLGALARCPDQHPAWAAAAAHIAAWHARSAEELALMPLLWRRRLLLAAEQAGDVNTARRLPGKWTES